MLLSVIGNSYIDKSFYVFLMVLYRNFDLINSGIGSEELKFKILMEMRDNIDEYLINKSE